MLLYRAADAVLIGLLAIATIPPEPADTVAGYGAFLGTWHELRGGDSFLKSGLRGIGPFVDHDAWVRLVHPAQHEFAALGIIGEIERLGLPATERRDNRRPGAIRSTTRGRRPRTGLRVVFQRHNSRYTAHHSSRVRSGSASREAGAYIFAIGVTVVLSTCDTAQDQTDYREAGLGLGARLPNAGLALSRAGCLAAGWRSERQRLHAALLPPLAGAGAQRSRCRASCRPAEALTAPGPHVPTWTYFIRLQG